MRGEGARRAAARTPGGGVAQQADGGLLSFRSVAPVAEWLRWDGGGGSGWAGWRWGSPQRERAGRGRGGEQGTPRGGYEHRTAPAGWRHRAPSMAEVAPLVPGRQGTAAMGGTVGGEGVVVGGVGGAFLHLEERDGEGAAGVGAAACFGQVSRRLSRLLKRLPKSRSWSDSLRMLRRSSSNGSLLNNSGRSSSSKRWEPRRGFILMNKPFPPPLVLLILNARIRGRFEGQILKTLSH